MNMTVSVVIGAYNSAAWIRQTLDSVLGQTYSAAEVLVIDDGSTDETAAIVQSYGMKVKYLAEAHRGRPHRNRGILESSGELVALVDADDYWQPQKLERQLRELRAQKAVWVICEPNWLVDATSAFTAQAGSRIREGDVLEALFLDNFIAASTPVVARHVFDDVGYFDESAEVAPVEDWDLWLRIAARYPLACVPERLATIRLHTDSFLAGTPLTRRVASLEHVISAAVAREPSRLGRLRRRALFNVYHAAGVRLFRQEQPSAARSFFLEAWRQRPGRAETLVYLVLTSLGFGASSSPVRLKRWIGGRR